MRECPASWLQVEAFRWRHHFPDLIFQRNVFKSLYQPEAGVSKCPENSMEQSTHEDDSQASPKFLLASSLS